MRALLGLWLQGEVYVIGDLLPWAFHLSVRKAETSRTPQHLKSDQSPSSQEALGPEHSPSQEVCMFFLHEHSYQLGCITVFLILSPSSRPL